MLANGPILGEASGKFGLRRSNLLEPGSFSNGEEPQDWDGQKQNHNVGTGFYVEGHYHRLSVAACVSAPTLRRSRLYE